MFFSRAANVQHVSLPGDNDDDDGDDDDDDDDDDDNVQPVSLLGGKVPLGPSCDLRTPIYLAFFVTHLSFVFSRIFVIFCCGKEGEIMNY